MRSRMRFDVIVRTATVVALLAAVGITRESASAQDGFVPLPAWEGPCGQTVAIPSGTTKTLAFRVYSPNAARDITRVVALDAPPFVSISGITAGLGTPSVSVNVVAAPTDDHRRSSYPLTLQGVDSSDQVATCTSTLAVPAPQWSGCSSVSMARSDAQTFTATVAAAPSDFEIVSVTDVAKPAFVTIQKSVMPSQSVTVTIDARPTPANAKIQSYPVSLSATDSAGVTGACGFSIDVRAPDPLQGDSPDLLLVDGAGVLQQMFLDFLSSIGGGNILHDLCHLILGPEGDCSAFRVSSDAWEPSSIMRATARNAFAGKR